MSVFFRNLKEPVFLAPESWGPIAQNSSPELDYLWCVWLGDPWPSLHKALSHWVLGSCPLYTELIVWWAVGAVCCLVAIILFVADRFTMVTHQITWSPVIPWGLTPRKISIRVGNLPIPVSWDLDIGNSTPGSWVIPTFTLFPKLELDFPGLTNVLGYFLKVDHSTVLLWSSSLAISPNNLSNWNHWWGSFRLPLQTRFLQQHFIINVTSSRSLRCLISMCYPDLCKRCSNFGLEHAEVFLLSLDEW